MKRRTEGSIRVVAAISLLFVMFLITSSFAAAAKGDQKTNDKEEKNTPKNTLKSNPGKWAEVSTQKANDQSSVDDKKDKGSSTPAPPVEEPEVEVDLRQQEFPQLGRHRLASQLLVPQLALLLQVPTVEETPVIEEPAIETPVVEEPAAPAEEIVVEVPTEAPIVEEAPIEEEPIVEATVEDQPEVPEVQEQFPEEPDVETPSSEAEEVNVEEQTVEEPIGEEPISEDTVEETPVIEEPAIETPVVEEPAEIVEDAAVETPAEETTVETAAEEQVVEGQDIEEPVVESPVEETNVDDQITEEQVVEEPVAEDDIEETVEETAAVEEIAVEQPVVEEQVATTEVAATQIVSQSTVSVVSYNQPSVATSVQSTVAVSAMNLTKAEVVTVERVYRQPVVITQTEAAPQPAPSTSPAVQIAQVSTPELVSGSSDQAPSLQTNTINPAGLSTVNAAPTDMTITGAGLGFLVLLLFVAGGLLRPKLLPPSIGLKKLQPANIIKIRVYKRVGPIPIEPAPERPNRLKVLDNKKILALLETPRMVRG